MRANNAESHREARACIKEALIVLMQQKSYKDISMTDIIQKSGISRAGVYKNYKNKDEILLDVYNEPINDVISALGNSVFENMELIFRTGKKHEKAITAMIDAGIEHYLLAIINKRFESVSISFYIPLWNGMIYNSFIEWAKSGMAEPVEEAIERVQNGLKLVAESIEIGLTNSTQNRRLS